MASPQKENGFTPIANEIIEHLVQAKMSGTEWQYVMCIFRKTYGWKKREDWVTNSQISQMTGLKKERVSEAKRRLLARNIVTEKRNKISIQKDWEKWIELRKSVTIVTEKRNSELRKSVHTKETITKEKISESKDSQSKNKKDMGWNKKSDNDDDLPVVDMDTGEVSGEKVRTKKYPNAPAVRKVFQAVLGKNPQNWRVNKNQLLACENLYTERGIEKVKRALEFYKEYKDEQYCPIINSPHDLDSKWDKLLNFKKKL